MNFSEYVVGKEVQFFRNVYGDKTINQIRTEVGQNSVDFGDDPYFEFIARQMLLNWKPSNPDVKQ